MQLQPPFANKFLLVSDDPKNVFLAHVRDALDRYPFIRKRGDRAADIFDSCFMAVREDNHQWNRTCTAGLVSTESHRHIAKVHQKP